MACGGGGDGGGGRWGAGGGGGDTDPGRGGRAGLDTLARYLREGEWTEEETIFTCDELPKIPPRESGLA